MNKFEIIFNKLALFLCDELLNVLIKWFLDRFEFVLKDKSSACILISINNISINNISNNKKVIYGL